MKSILNTFATFAAVMAITIAISASPSLAQLSMSLERVGTGFDRSVFATHAPGDLNRLFVLESHSGDIEILDLATGTTNASPFLTIPNISTGTEQGLLGLAFHPDYAANGQFYVNYTNSSGATVVEQYTRNTADLANTSGTQVLSFNQPQGNHNAGWIDFGPDGFLYIATGDGGGSDDNDSGHTSGIGNSQDITNNLLGKILRVDVNGDDFVGDAARNYAIPANNPLVGQTGDDEIYAYGLRNPFRNSFDSQTGDLYIADVGQNTREEINVLRNGSGGGENYGWRPREGTISTPSGGVGGPRTADLIDPIYEYNHGNGPFEGRSVTGGYVYRGPIDALDGHYIFGDFASNGLWSFRFDETLNEADFDGMNFVELIDWTDILTTDAGSLNGIASFAEDELGNVYVVELGGDIFLISAAVPEPGSACLLIALGGLMFSRRRRN